MLSILFITLFSRVNTTWIPVWK